MDWLTNRRGGSLHGDQLFLRRRRSKFPFDRETETRLPLMMSPKILEFLSPPPCAHLELIHAIKFTQSPLLCPLFHDPPPPSDVDIIFYLEAPEAKESSERLRRGIKVSGALFPLPWLPSFLISPSQEGLRATKRYDLRDAGGRLQPKPTRTRLDLHFVEIANLAAIFGR